MTPLDRRPALRWLVPAAVAVVLVGGGSAIGAISAAARGGLPHRTAAQLLVDVQNARLDGLSGTIAQSSDLGLPALPGMGSGSSDMTSLVSGSHTLRLWYAGPEHVRLALLGTLGESDLVRNGTDLWTWSSSGRSATHRTLPAGEKKSAPAQLPTVGAMTPQQAADAALKAITPSTKVSTDGTAMVAGRSAYELVLQPRDAHSLVDSVRIAVDGRTHVPTRVQVLAKGGSGPAFEIGFTAFDPTTPSMAVFRFNPPPGTTLTQGTTAIPGSRTHRDHGSDAPSTQGTPSTSTPKGPATAAPKVVGTGWTSVMVATLPAGSLSGSSTSVQGLGSLQSLLEKLPKASGSWGSGHVLRGTVFSAVLTDDGRVAVGAVAPQMLYDALGRG